jgi:hypothetical protein
MQTNKVKNKSSWFLILIIFVLNGCVSNVLKTYISPNIPNDISKSIHSLNEQFFKAIKNKDLASFKRMLSPQLLESQGQKIDSLLNILSLNINGANSYIEKKEFYTVNSSKEAQNTLYTGLTDDYDFSLNYKAINKEMYVSLIIPETKSEQLLITCIYGKYDNEWKINIFHLGLYSFDNKNVIDIYKQAKVQFQKGYLVDATISMLKVQQIIRPSGPYLKYRIEDEIINFQKKVQNESQLKIKFPIQIPNIPTQPVIVDVFPQSTTEGIFPSIVYYSKIPFSDTLRLKKENEEIHEVISNIYPGIKLDKKYLFYKALNQMPDGKSEIRSWGFVKQFN